MSLRDQIRGFVLQTFLFTDDPNELGDEESFLDRGIIDSTGVLELVMYLEDEFDLTVSDEELTPENFDSVARVSSFVRQKTPGRD